MIKLFYTGAGSFNTAQTLASKSLGGFISNTAIPNGVINSLFSPLSLMEFYNKKKITQYIGLGLYLFFFDDEEKAESVNLKFKLSYDEENDKEAEFFKDLFDYKVGLGPISGDSTNGYYIERIAAGAKPYYMTNDFQKLNFEEEIQFESVNLNQGGTGVWLSRTFNPTKFKEKFNFDAEYWENNDTLPNIDFNIKLNVNFSYIEDPTI